MTNSDPEPFVANSATGAHWQPIIDGPRAAKAWSLLEEIATESLSAEGLGAVLSGRDPSLGAGTSGVALFFAYLGGALAESRYLDIAGELAEKAVEQLTQTQTSASLHSGFTGVAWVNEHLRGRVFEEGEDDPNEQVDDLLLKLLEEPWRAGHDLIAGLVGIGVYALERLPRGSANRCLELVVERLGETADPTTNSKSWLTPPTLLSQRQREIYPSGCYDLGMAHGVPGVIAFLGCVCGRIESRRAGQLLDGAIEWLNQQRNPYDTDSRFPYVCGPDIEPSTVTRLGWCYGDPGVSASLLVAGTGVGNRRWIRAAIDLALAAAQRDPDTAGIVDGGLCHGSAGLAHIFNRLFHATGKDIFRMAALYWWDRTFELQQPGLGVAGFRAWEGDAEGRGHWRLRRGFLTGTAGIGLALLAALRPQVPEWDRVLLLSRASP